MTYPPGPANSGYTPRDNSGQFSLASMANPPRRRRWLIPALIVGFVVALGGGVALGAAATGEDPPPPVAATSSPGAGSPKSTSVKDSAGQRACDAVKKANVAPVPVEPAAMADIANDGTQSPNPFVAAASEELRQAAKAAVAARGTEDAATRAIQMLTAALKLETTCIQQWYYPKP